MIVRRLALALCVVGGRLLPHSAARRLARDGGAGAPEAKFVGRAECARCHAREDSLWKGSHHDRAMQAASDADGPRRFQRRALHALRGDEHLHAARREVLRAHRWARRRAARLRDRVHLRRLPAAAVPHRLPRRPLPGAERRLGCAPEGARAGSDGSTSIPKEAVPHDDVLHWTGAYQNWNFMCAECHSTNVVKGYDPKTGEYHTTFSEINVSCEACHGPGSRHVAWARRRGRQGARSRASDHGLVVDAARQRPRRRGSSTRRPGSPRRSAPRATHARDRDVRALPRAPLGAHRAVHRPGGRSPTRTGRASCNDPLYFADGQIRDEVYEYALLPAEPDVPPRRDLHRLPRSAPRHHRARRWTPSAHAATRRRCSRRRRTRTTSRTRRRRAACAATCRRATTWWCTRATTTASGSRAPTSRVALGTPNACSGCHADRSAAWAAAASAKWWTKRAGEPQYGQALDARPARGARQRRGARRARRRHARMPAIARATAVGSPRPAAHAAGGARAAARALRPRSARARRRGAGAASRLAAGAARASSSRRCSPTPSRLVRIEAARALATAPPSLFDEAQQAAFPRALAEYRAEQRVERRPRRGAALPRRVLRRDRADSTARPRSTRTALQAESALLAIYVNLADLYRQQGREADAERVLRDGLARAPKGAGAELYYALGLTLHPAAAHRRRARAARRRRRARARRGALRARVRARAPEARARGARRRTCSRGRSRGTPTIASCSRPTCRSCGRRAATVTHAARTAARRSPSRR